MELEIFGKKYKASIRRASDLKPVLAYPEKLTEDFDAYYMFRDIYRNEAEQKRILDARLRYDYTIIPPAEIGGECIKTYGHYHPEVHPGMSYPEVYQVLEGEAIYLLQKVEGDRVVDCIAVESKRGDVVIIPPNYGHVTINPSNKTLKMSNWVCREFSSIYEPYTRMRGACYYYVNKQWIGNPRYPELPDLKFAKPVNVLNISGEMYDLVDDIGRLSFLTAPQKNEDLFKNCLKIK
ncbi:glucose-6-phosphate isomerase [Archaeoglobales archaeon]|nr:MAG: glucose-6-phosphate isomerase [Archaeoglobales archaeon ex4484_92]RLI83729.1 MAG: glucose-6-phosphate isomerase [Archaeoglobales archaeon]